MGRPRNSDSQVVVLAGQFGWIAGLVRLEMARTAPVLPTSWHPCYQLSIPDHRHPSVCQPRDRTNSAGWIQACTHHAHRPCQFREVSASRLALCIRGVAPPRCGPFLPGTRPYTSSPAVRRGAVEAADAVGSSPSLLGDFLGDSVQDCRVTPSRAREHNSKAIVQRAPPMSSRTARLQPWMNVGGARDGYCCVDISGAAGVQSEHRRADHAEQ